MFGIHLQEMGMISLAALSLLASTASQTTAPLFFGMVVDAAQTSMGMNLNMCLIYIFC